MRAAKNNTSAGTTVWYTKVVFTVNNWTEEEYTWITTQFINACKWLCVGKEIAPGTGLFLLFNLLQELVLLICKVLVY